MATSELLNVKLHLTLHFHCTIFALITNIKLHSGGKLREKNNRYGAIVQLAFSCCSRRKFWFIALRKHFCISIARIAIIWSFFPIAIKCIALHHHALDCMLNHNNLVASLKCWSRFRIILTALVINLFMWNDLLSCHQPLIASRMFTLKTQFTALTTHHRDD